MANKLNQYLNAKRYDQKLMLHALIVTDTAPALALARKVSDMMDSIGVASIRFISGDASRMSGAGAVSSRDGRGDGHIQTHCGFAGYAIEAYATGSADLPSCFAPLAAIMASADIERPEIVAD